MARKAPLKDLPQEERPAFLAQLAALDGVDLAEFPALARRAAERYHDAVLAGHVDVLAEAETAYSALVYVLNGSTFFGCGAGDDSPWYVLERAVAAAPGQVPRWGQAGHFLLEVDGMRVRVKLSSNMLGNHRSGTLHAVDLDKPFLSETGYRSSGLIVSASLGETVDQAARAMVLDILKSEGGPKPIRSDDRERLRSAKVPAWLADVLAGVTPDGQLAMFGDAPPVRIAKDAAQRQRDARRRRKEQGLKPVPLSADEQALLMQLRDLRKAAVSDPDPLPYILTTRDRVYLAKALDFYDYLGEPLGSDYVKGNLRDLFLRLDKHKPYADPVDWPPLEKRKAWFHKQTTDRLFADYRAQVARLEERVATLEKQNAFEVAECAKAYSAAGVLTERLKRAGLCHDYRKQPGE